MNHNPSSDIELYFPVKDRAFHWVRNGSLYSPAATQRGIKVRAMFREEEMGAGVPVFDRFESGFYFRKLHSLCVSAGIPYLVDLDDLIWDLPKFSNQYYAPPKYLLEFPEQLMSRAAGITVSTLELKEQVEHRFPGSQVFLVENCLPAWTAPKSGALIANTDAFKMGEGEVSWFIDLLRLIFDRGLSIQLLGHNQNLLERCGDIVVHSLPMMEYKDYLHNLAVTDYALGLIPVEQSIHADCKSAIKAIEFTAQRVPTIASDIAPYRRFADRHDMADFVLVPNTFEAWRNALEALIRRIPEPELERGRKINMMLKATRDTQLQQWLCVLDFLRDRQPDGAIMKAVRRKLRPYRFAYNNVRPILLPVRSFLRGGS